MAIKISVGKKRLYLCAFAILAIFSAVIVGSFSKFGMVKYYVAYAPFSATVTANGQVVKNNAYNYFKPGDYEFRAELENFETVVDQITIPNGLIGVYGALEPNNEAGFAMMESAKADYISVGKGAYSDHALEPTYAIFNYLPIGNSIYKIESYIDVSATPYQYQINIVANPIYYDDAIKRLYTMTGIDAALAAYDIRFPDYQNPFTVPTGTSTATDPQQFIAETYASTFAAADYKFAESTAKSSDYKYTGVVFCTQQPNDGPTSTSRVILKRTGDSWTVLAPPYPVVTEKQFSDDIPTTFLNRVNQLSCYN